MANTKKIIRALAKKFPQKIAKKHHDYVGLMYGKLKEETKKILLCLDFDGEVLEIARRYQPDIVITHHPFIYGTKYQVLKNDAYKRELCQELDKLGFPIYSFHTNFDEGEGGMNDALAQKIGLVNIRPLQYESLGRIGDLPQAIELHEAARLIKEKLGVTYGLLLPYGSHKVQSIAIIGGGGGTHYATVFQDKVDLFVSGDAPHYIRRNMVIGKYNYLDLPHEIEKIFMETMKKHLLQIDEKLDILCVDHELLPEII